MGAITLYSAGAGTGKTYAICQEIADRVTKGLDPRRILAATFTRKAAAELKSRVQKHLLSKGLVQKAEEMELAAMGTVHSVGHQLVSRFALRLGLSPELAIMPEGSDETWLKDMLSGLDPKPMERMLEVCARFGHDEGVLFKLIRAKRQNSIPDKDFQEHVLADAKRFCQVMGCGHSGHAGHGWQDAVKEARELAKKAVGDMAKFKGYEAEAAYKDLSRLMRYGADTWSQLAKLSKLECKDESLDGCLEPLRSFAGKLLRHPGLSADVMEFAHTLALQAVTLEKHYREYKTARGLLDYTDLEELFYGLVTNPSLRDELADEIQLVVIDEFQDTNPIQLAIFMALSDIAGQSIWVGDSKQSIYGFNGTDPQLMKAVWQLPKVHKQSLGINRRSGKGLVEFFNEVFTHEFGAASKLEPQHKAGPSRIERWLLEAKNYGQEASAIANGVAGLVTDGVKKSDIAILVRTNDHGAAIASYLLDLGIPVNMGLSGLLSTRECAVAIAALRVVEDRQDSLAAATLLQLLEDQTGKTPGWLKMRLAELEKGRVEAPFQADPIIGRLADLDRKTLSPVVAISTVADILGLSRKVGDWTEPARRNTHLDGLIALAQAYEEGAAVEGRAVTLRGFISHLEELRGEGEDEITPPYGLDAVNVLTYHKSKGLEWPVVVLAQLDKVFEGDPFAPWVTGGDPDHGKPLKGRELRYWPNPFGGELPLGLDEEVIKTKEFKQLADQEHDESLRILYVGFTRAKEQLILATRVTQTKKEEKHKHQWLDRLSAFSKNISAMTTPGKHKVHGVETNLVVKRVQNEPADAVAKGNSAHHWFKDPKPKKVVHPDRMRSPSQEPAVKTELKAVQLSGDQPRFGKVTEGTAEQLGNAMHAYFATLPSLFGESEKTMVACAKRVIESYGMGDAMPPEALVAVGERLKQWVDMTYPGAVWHTEVPLTAPAKDGRQWHGFVDLLLELSEGRVALIDHKSSLRADSVKEFSGQVRAYAEALGTCGKRVEACWLHLPFAGAVLAIN
jgi:ATP-dependent exoDNAse (exonuclease V) beta subunit